MPSVSIMIADGNILLRKFLRMLIQGDPKVSVIKEADDGLDLLEQLNNFRPDILILETSLPTLPGLDAAKIIRELYPEVKIVIMAKDTNSNIYHKASGIGVHGYILKNEIENMNCIIDSILKGKPYISPHFKKTKSDKIKKKSCQVESKARDATKWTTPG
jgi:DNA-binding NarL/FixJ family response regulator